MPKQFKPEAVVRVARLHVERYQKRVELGRQGHRNVNLAECEYYLQLWQGIVDKKGEHLTLEELNEVTDAYDSGEYEDLFNDPSN